MRGIDIFKYTFNWPQYFLNKLLVICNLDNIAKKYIKLNNIGVAKIKLNLTFVDTSELMV